MDDRRIDKMMERRERGYIWLEQKLKWNLTVTTLVVAVFFFIMRALNADLRYWGGLFTAGILVNTLWCFLLYRREYRDYQAIFTYLQEFEEGNYTYRTDQDYMRSGIHSQLSDQLERLGSAFGVLKERLTVEEENTKELITDISHQLKTPVAAIGMSLELLDDEKLTLEEKEEFLARGREEVHRLTHLMGTLTNLSRLETDMIRLDPKENSLKQTLIRAVNGVYMKAGEKGIEIEMEEFRDITLVHDARWTAEAFANVIDNAVKYSPAQTRVQIRVVAYISYVFIEVEDAGIGIPREERTEIFKRFYRGKHPAVEASEGAGVGLYLVRKILEAQGGSVRVLPGCGTGSVFQMMLPKKYEK